MTMQVQVVRNNLLLSAPAHPLSVANAPDLTRIRYAAEIPLKSLPAGVYALQVTATDRATKRDVTQEISFVVN